MATPTYDLLDSVTLATAASSVTFSSIDQSYGDLILVVTGSRSATGNVGLRVQFNSDTGNNYHVVKMSGDGSTAASSADSPNDYVEGSNSRSFSAVSISTATVQIMDYSATDKHKSTLARSSRADASEGYAYASASRWASTLAVTSLLAYLASGSFSVGSTLNLYGVAK